MSKQPTNSFHPGEILRGEFLEPMQISQTAFAATSDAGINRFGRQTDTPEKMALRIITTCGTSRTGLCGWI